MNGRSKAGKRLCTRPLRCPCSSSLCCTLTCTGRGNQEQQKQGNADQRINTRPQRPQVQWRQKQNTQQAQGRPRGTRQNQRTAGHDAAQQDKNWQQQQAEIVRVQVVADQQCEQDRVGKSKVEPSRRHIPCI